MMEAQIKALSGKVTIKVTGENPKALFKELAGAMEIFGADIACGCCDGQDLNFRVRLIENKFEYYELSCGNIGCRAVLSFGQRTEGNSLFPKRKDESGNWLPDRGWHIYKG